MSEKVGASPTFSYLSLNPSYQITYWQIVVASLDLDSFSATKCSIIHQVSLPKCVGTISPAAARRPRLGKIGAPPTFPYLSINQSYETTYRRFPPGEPRPRRIFIPKYMRFFRLQIPLFLGGSPRTGNRCPTLQHAHTPDCANKDRCHKQGDRCQGDRCRQRKVGAPQSIADLSLTHSKEVG